MQKSWIFMNFGKKADYVHFEATSFSFDITVYQTANIVNLNNQLLGLVTLSRVTYVFIFNLNVSWNRAICASDFELQHSQMRKKKTSWELFVTKSGSIL